MKLVTELLDHSIVIYTRIRKWFIRLTQYIYIYIYIALTSLLDGPAITFTIWFLSHNKKPHLQKC